CIQVLQTPHSF
nr:immunoglobulin light chain junction region [Macaca mulatta]